MSFRALSPGRLVSVLVVMMLWALCYPLIETGLAWAPPLRFAVLRSFLAGASLVAVASLSGRPLPSGSRVWGNLALIGLGTTTLGFAGMFLAGGRITPGMATVLANAQPIAAAGLAYVVLGERLSGRTALALGLGLSGIVVISARSLLSSPAGGEPSAIAWVLLGALGVAIGNVFFKRLSHRVDPLMAAGWQFLLGSAVLLVASVGLEANVSVRWDPRFLLDLSALALFGTALPLVLWFHLLKHEQLNRLNAFTFLTPVFALVIGLSFYGERLSPLDGFGGLLVVGGALLAGTRPSGPLKGGERLRSIGDSASRHESPR